MFALNANKGREKKGSEQRQRAHGCTDVMNIATCDTLELLLWCGFHQKEEVEKVATNSPVCIDNNAFLFQLIEIKKK